MDRRRLSISLGPLLMAGVLSVASGEGSPARHLALESSVPAADAVVVSPTEIRLTFTEEPQQGTTSIRLVDGAGDLVVTGETTQSSEDATVFTASVEGTLASGPYTVSWRAMAEDGHVVAEEFGFTVRASD